MVLTMLPYSTVNPKEFGGYVLKTVLEKNQEGSINDFALIISNESETYLAAPSSLGLNDFKNETSEQYQMTETSGELIQITNTKSIPVYKSDTNITYTETNINIPKPVGILYVKELDKYETFIVVDELPKRSDIVELIRKYFPVTEWSRAERVAGCESGMRSNAKSKPNKNQTTDIGVYQLNDGGTLQGLLSRLGYSKEQTYLALNAEWNIMAAHRLWTERGWAPWVCAYKLGIVEDLWSSKPGPNW